jgi:hypothetical protein
MIQANVGLSAGTEGVFYLAEILQKKERNEEQQGYYKAQETATAKGMESPRRGDSRRFRTLNACTIYPEYI